MKLKKIVAIVLVITILILTGAQAVFAMPGKNKGGMPPGILKNMILKSNLSEDEAVELIIENTASLSPGVLKEIILKLNLSKDALEKLADEGILRGLPGGILKEIYLNNDDEEIEVDGIITDIDAADKVIEIDGILYELPEEVVVELDDQEAYLEDLKVGMIVELEIEDEKAEIEAESVEIVVTLEGIIEGLDLIGIYHITIDEIEYKLAAEVVVTLEDEEASLQDLDIGMEVKVEVVKGEVVKICVQKIGYEVVEGIIEELDLIGAYHITIDEVEYKLAAEVVVTLEDEEASLQDLEVGMEAEIKIVEEEVVRINAQNVKPVKVEGIITDLDLIGLYHIKIDETEYVLSREAQVVINDSLSCLEDLEQGMSVVVKVLEDIVVKVNVEFQIQVVEGKITGLDVVDRYIVIDEVEYKLANEVEIRLNNEEVVLQDLELEMQTKAVVFKDEIVELNVIKEEILEAQGEISAIDLNNGYITINGVQYQLSTDIFIKVDGEQASLQDLIVGMHAEAELNEEVILKIYAVTIDSNKIKGTITDLDLIGIYHLTIDEEEYNLLNKATVTLNYEEAKLEDLQVGMSAIIYIVDSNIVKIQATKVVKERILGEIKDIDLIGDYYIKINDDEYALSREAQVTIDEQEVTLHNLEKGMEAYLHTENNLVTRVDAYSSEFIIIIGLLNFIDVNERIIHVDGVLYNLADVIIVNIDEAEATFTELESGMDVELQVDNGLVTTVNAGSIEQIEVLEVKGQLMNIDIEAKTITIDEDIYDLADNIDVLTVNEANSFLEDLVVYMNVEVELQNKLVTKIAAEDNVEHITGEVIEVILTNTDIKLTIAIGNETAQYQVGEDLLSSNSELLSLGSYAQFAVVNNIIVEADTSN